MTAAGDLFTWRDEADAATAAAAAEARREEARRRLRLAGPGTVRERREAFNQATTQALAAEVALQRLRQANGEGQA